NRGATLKIVQGATAEAPDKPFELSTSEPLKIELLAQNLIEVRVTGGGFGKSVPTVELRRKPPEDPFAGSASASASASSSGSGPPAQPVYQSFQMMPLRAVNERHVDAGAENEEATAYAISFAVSEPVELFIPALSDTKPLAVIKVRQLPIPKVKLS